MFHTAMNQSANIPLFNLEEKKSEHSYLVNNLGQVVFTNDCTQENIFTIIKEDRDLIREMTVASGFKEEPDEYNVVIQAGFHNNISETGFGVDHIVARKHLLDFRHYFNSGNPCLDLIAIMRMTLSRIENVAGNNANTALAWVKENRAFVFAIDMKIQLESRQHVVVILYRHSKNMLKVGTLYTIDKETFDMIKEGKDKYQSIKVKKPLPVQPSTSEDKKDNSAPAQVQSEVDKNHNKDLNQNQNENPVNNQLSNISVENASHKKNKRKKKKKSDSYSTTKEMLSDLTLIDDIFNQTVPVPELIIRGFLNLGNDDVEFVENCLKRVAKEQIKLLNGQIDRLSQATFAVVDMKKISQFLNDFCKEFLEKMSSIKNKLQNLSVKNTEHLKEFSSIFQNNFKNIDFMDYLSQVSNWQLMHSDKKKNIVDKEFSKFVVFEKDLYLSMYGLVRKIIDSQQGGSNSFADYYHKYDDILRNLSDLKSKTRDDQVKKYIDLEMEYIQKLINVNKLSEELIVTDGSYIDMCKETRILLLFCANKFISYGLKVDLTADIHHYSNAIRFVNDFSNVEMIVKNDCVGSAYANQWEYYAQNKIKFDIKYQAYYVDNSKYEIRQSPYYV